MTWDNTRKIPAAHTHAESDVTDLATDLSGKEPAISKGTAFNKNYGATATDVKINGVQAVGSVDEIARIDHVHPTDTTREPLSGSGNATTAAPAIIIPNKGGIFNGSFERAPTFVAVQTASNWIDGTAAGSATVDKYGWYFCLFGAGCAGSVQFDPTVSFSGAASMKIISTSSGAGCVVYVATAKNTMTSSFDQTLTRNYFPVKPSTKYRLSGVIKTSAVTNAVGGGGFELLANIYNSDCNTMNYYPTPLVTGTTDFANYSVTFTTSATATYGMIVPYFLKETGTVWVDNIKFDEVAEDTGYTGTVSTPLLSTITGVTSTGNVDQSLDPTFAAAYHYDLTNAVNEGATHRQTFTPTKNHVYSIKAKVIAKGTGNWTLEIHSAANVAIASQTIANASLSNTTITEFILPCLWTTGVLHFHLYSSVADGTVAVGTADHDLETCSYIQYYAKPTENATIVCNGDKISLSADQDGILGGAIIDLDKGEYLYDSGYMSNGTAGKIAAVCAFANNVYAADAGTYLATYLNIINSWVVGAGGIESNTTATAKTLTLKVNTLLPIKHLKVTHTGNVGYATYGTDIYLSLDGVNFTKIGMGAVAPDGTPTFSCDSDLANGSTIFYLKISGQATLKNIHIRELAIEADIDTTSLPVPQIYPIAINQFSEKVILPTASNRIYFRLSKYSNQYGEVVPHLEFCINAVPIKAVPTPIDNSQETNPAIAIVKADTLYGQANGTGSDEGGNYILNDGEYMTLSTATAAPMVTYQVGKGTTAFTNITKNVIYLSSNGVTTDATKDPSHQMSVVTWYRLQSLAKTVNDVVRKVSNMAIQLIPSTLWKNWTPVLTWTTGTPVTGLTTVARYTILGTTCFFSFNVVSTDSNACTNLTITLPVLPKDNDLYYSLNAIERYGAAGATYINPLAYIDDDGATNVIAFRAFATATDNQAVEVTVSGWYEI